MMNEAINGGRGESIVLVYGKKGLRSQGLEERLNFA